MPPVLSTEGLSKRYGRIQAVEDVALELHEGDIYGFLGLNGAGKTTTMRMILRLVRPDRGRVEIFGRDVRAHFVSIMRHVGCLIELPAFYPHLSAARNLRLLRMLDDNIPDRKVDEVLAAVGLSERRHSPVRTYSQGMRQRLGIAMSLLSAPRLVLLDEPTNGLDPQGIHEMRALILSLNRERGTTFLISSHLLHEVEGMCNRVGIIRGGRMVVQDRLEALLARTLQGVRIEAVPRERAVEFLRALPFVQDAIDDGGAIRVNCDPHDFPRLHRELVAGGLDVGAFVPIRLTLEEFFLNRERGG